MPDYSVKVAEEHIISRQGKPYALYAGLLDAFHRMYRDCSRGIDTQVVQIQHKDNEYLAAVKACAWVEVDGVKMSFTATGDASPNENRARQGQPAADAPLRMAETRAKARALRDAINLSGTSVDETDDYSEERGAAPKPHRPTPVPDPPEVASKSDRLKLADLIVRAGRSVDKFEERYGPIQEINPGTCLRWIEKLEDEVREVQDG